MRANLTRLAVAVVLISVTAACDDGSGPRDEEGRVTAGDVRVAAPEGWERIDEPTDAPLVTSTRFVDPDQRLQLVQVVVGCDPAGLDTLVGAVGQPRGALVVTGAEEHVPPPEVDGLDRARRVTLTLAGAEDPETTAVVTEALYGQRGDALVLVEVNVPVDDGDVDADTVLASVAADGEALEASCQDGTAATPR